MKIQLTDKELKDYLSLQQCELGFWKYEIKTTKGSVIGSKIKTKEDAIAHANKHLIIILKSTIK
tara:strand:+ start:645 stop:836 length:192 start_codon:yes stop_codon:yes gene_type:complete